MNNSTDDFLNQLRQVTENLLWMSEADYPFSIIYWENVDIREKLLEGKENKKIEVRELDKFFSRDTQEKDWYNQEEKAECKRYQELVKLLKTNLSEVKVYRIGEVEVDCYILGKTEDAIVGLSTVSVET
jgi:hypothetical protein